MNKFKKHPSDTQTISLLIPVLILVGFYLILNGHVIPGGGFQGGAALAAVLISYYLVTPAQKVDTKLLQSIEKYVFIVFALCAVLYILLGLYWNFPQWYEAYMIIMNLLIGIKVFCGLSIVFFQFALEDND